ncbi:MAG TPA: Ig-like domain-containing protein [Bryobacteraceae bacterium]|nr:Ig-like domain-containing protein [Bryobacteraceae bacterium]
MFAAHAATIHLENGAFRVDGWKPTGDPASMFSVHVGMSETPMLGDYEVAGDSVIFRPRFPLSSGVSYRAVFHPPGAAKLETVFEGPAPPNGPKTSVTQIYPTADTVPENTLKFYVVFSAPMSQGEAWKNLKLLDGQGKAVDLPFLEMRQELWNPESTRLTVLFAPGRIKRGLVPNLEDGPPLRAGTTYTLTIDQGWKDARGLPLASTHIKKFRVGSADRTPPEPNRWKVTAPKAGTRDALQLDFGKSMDYALLLRLVSVPSVNGSVEIGPGESVWRFTPDDPWKAGVHQIKIDTALEDLSGNGVGRPFDIDVFEKVTKTIERKTVSVPFRVR